MGFVSWASSTKIQRGLVGPAKQLARQFHRAADISQLVLQLHIVYLHEVHPDLRQIVHQSGTDTDTLAQAYQALDKRSVELTVITGQVRVAEAAQLVGLDVVLLARVHHRAVRERVERARIDPACLQLFSDGLVEREEHRIAFRHLHRFNNGCRLTRTSDRDDKRVTLAVGDEVEDRGLLRGPDALCVARLILDFVGSDALGGCHFACVEVEVRHLGFSGLIGRVRAEAVSKSLWAD
jgi:anti-anti-sigma regulatory factor